MKLRVQLLERWDRVSVDVPEETPVAALKRDVLASFGIGAAAMPDYVVKLRGWEVKGEQGSVAESGARDGSTYLITLRRRRAVR
ncbi:MAG TPA: hypothetical protein VGI97_10790 [Gemmatimonadaceae bacterium]|jgi:hypothetical protein